MSLSLPIPRRAQSGIALILTLILLSVITFLTLAFLALSRREKIASTVAIDQTRAIQAAQAAAARAQAQIISQILATTNAWNYGLMVSTNYINPDGFNPALGAHPTNVSYAYANGLPLNPADHAQNIANLFYDPRPPVFVETFGGTNLDFRYYLDLNRNFRYDTNGLITLIGPDGQPLRDLNNQPIQGFAVGDPEFIGLTQNLGERHSPSNQFLQRFAFIVLPAGKTIDLNTAHNQARHTRIAGASPATEGFMRNQGMGAWELNVAAALEDINTNYWGSALTAINEYRPPPFFPETTYSTGPAYLDALALLRYRYDGYWTNLPTALQNFGPAADLFRTNYVDEYGNGPLWLETAEVFDGINDTATVPWPGGDNPNAFFNHQDLFHPLKTGRNWEAAPPTNLPITFSDRLFQAGTNVDSYNRYTFYRLLDTLGLDSGPEPAHKLNLNFVNVDGIRETNLLAWQPIDFFTNAIDRLLRDPLLCPYPGLSATNIPVYPTNYYTPGVHRLLQVAANLYDATTTNAWPTVFRPHFENRGGQVTIAGWTEVINPQFVLNARYLDLANTNAMAVVQSDDIINGIPLVIGAKKGLPNLNEVAMQTIIQASRKLELRRPNINSLPNETNQMYYVGISNVFGIEAWNSYATAYPRPLEMRAFLSLSLTLTNEVGLLYQTNYTFPPNGDSWYPFPVINANTWPGSPVDPVNRRYLVSDTNAFRVPLSGGLLVLSNSAYLQTPTGGGVFGSVNSPMPRNAGFPVPQLWLITTVRVRYALVDTTFNRLVDFVTLAQLDRTIDLSAQLMSLDAGDEPGVVAQQWRTNRIGTQAISSPTEGIVSQIQVSLGNEQTDLSVWTSYGGNRGNVRDKEKAIDGFRAFLGLTPISSEGQLNPPNITNLTMQTPFNPVRKLSLQASWQANDPLVHYLAGDLTDLSRTNEVEYVTPPNQTPARLLSNLGRFNTRTQPWGGNPSVSTDTNRFALEVKDPGVRRSDDWEFPGGQFANVGWIGRVHRGTPWQTIYLKDKSAVEAQWRHWSGNPDLVDARYSHPTNDFALLEHFTATYDARTTRGQLSINSDNLAAWSAVLAGVVAMSNSIPDPALLNNPYLTPEFTPVLIPSAGIAGPNSALAYIVNGIHQTRANTNLFPRQVFGQLGDILRVPELTTRSPLIVSNSTQLQRGLTDAAVERIPQQILGLLRGQDDPRFVIFAYGQSLRPASANAFVLGGPLSGLCTNYAITAEAAFRTVVRVEGAPLRPRAVVESFNFLAPD